MWEDTICALATAAVEAGIGIIRISGSEAVSTVSGMILTKNGNKVNIKESHRVKYGYFYDKDRMIDEVLVLTMLGPKSFTGEDVVEIHCHGGILVMQTILRTLLNKGIRAAMPGEFTKRAFLNGRIDLSEAEAVSDIISSETEYALDASVKQLKGSVSRKVDEFRKEILEYDAYIEAALDDPEHLCLDGYKEELKEKIASIINEIDILSESASDGKIIREGLKTVILGKPNAGKSSVLNYLVGSERAIVTDIAGTTRDTLEETIRLDQIILHLIDTAGIHDTEDVVEKIGVEKARKAAHDADLIIYVVDTSVPLDDNDSEIMEIMNEKNSIVLLNKSDLPAVIDKEDIRKKTKSTCIKISALNQTGMQEIKETIQDMFFHNNMGFNDQLIITNIRHRQCLINASDALKEVISSIDMDMPEDFYTIDLMRAYQELGYILGEEVGEDLINEIFRKFCMGK